MADYLNFSKILPLKPNDPLVNEDTQLNDNWDLLDTKLQPYMIGGSLTLTEVGQESFNGSFRYSVWDGAAQRLPDDIDAGWSSWTALPILSPRVARGSFTPRWRNNTAYRMVELSGGVLFDASANPWTMGSAFQVNQLASGSPTSALAPIGGTHKGPCATALSAGTTIVAGGLVTVDSSGGFCRINAQYMGGPGGGNFLMLDQVWWWY
jgi:hypothetical protein